MATAASRNVLTALVLALLTVGALIAPLCQAAAADDDDGPGDGDGEAAAAAAAEPLITAAELRKTKAHPPPRRQRTRGVKTRPPAPDERSPGTANAKPPQPPQREVVLEGLLSVVLHGVREDLKYRLRLSSGDIIPLFISDRDAVKEYIGTRVRVELLLDSENVNSDGTFVHNNGSPIPVINIVRIDTDPDNSSDNGIGVDEVFTGGVKPVVVDEVEVLADELDTSANVRNPSPRVLVRPSPTPRSSPRTSTKPPASKKPKKMV